MYFLSSYISLNMCCDGNSTTWPPGMRAGSTTGTILPKKRQAATCLFFFHDASGGRRCSVNNVFVGGLDNLFWYGISFSNYRVSAVTRSPNQYRFASCRGSAAG